MREIGHFIGGKEAKGASGRFGDVFNPNTGEVQAKVAYAKHAEVEHAIAVAEAAQTGWAAVNPQRRARVLMKFLDLAQKEFDALARLLSSEHGKTFADAKGDVQRGLEVVEFACGIPHLLKGEYTEGAGPGIDLFSMRQPLGVVAGITPFNFPAMIPMWKFAPGACLRQCLHPQTVGARPLGADAACRIAPGSGTAGRRAQRRQRRQGSGRHAPYSIRASRRSASSAPRRSPNMSTQPPALTTNARNASAAPRTT